RAGAPLERGVEILRDHDEAAQLAGDEQRLELAAIAREAHIEIARGRERRAELAGRAGRILDDDADGDLLEIERYGEREQEQQHDRQNERDQEVRRIANDLEAFLANDRREPRSGEAASVRAHAARSSSSACDSTIAMNASSIVGAGFSALAAAALSSSGRASAIRRARWIIATRSQYSASSMKCVVT